MGPDLEARGFVRVVGAVAALVGGVGVAVSLALSAAGVPPLVAAGSVVVLVAIAWARVAGRGRRALSELGARRLATGEEPRVRNLMTGLAADAEAPLPGLWLIEDDGPNALVCHAGGPAVAFTTGLLRSCTHTELEAVAAHCLQRARTARRLNLYDAAAPLARRLLHLDTCAVDLRAAAATRYPPALASAIAKAAVRNDRFGFFWFVPPGGYAATRDRRVAELLDL
ncbi:MAG: hypothetical protein ABR575_01515 [Actinomycetota bacterium]